MQYRPSVQHQLADGVSRLRTDTEDTMPVDDEVPCFDVQYQEGSDPLQDKVHWDHPQDRPHGCHALPVTPGERDAPSILVEEFLREQAGDAIFRAAADAVGTATSKIQHGPLRFPRIEVPLDRTLQRVVRTQRGPGYCI